MAPPTRNPAAVLTPGAAVPKRAPVAAPAAQPASVVRETWRSGGSVGPPLTGTGHGRVGAAAAGVIAVSPRAALAVMLTAGAEILRVALAGVFLVKVMELT